MDIFLSVLSVIYLQQHLVKSFIKSLFILNMRAHMHEVLSTPCMRERAGVKDARPPLPQLRLHTFSAVVRRVRHGCLQIWAEQGQVTPHCVEDRGKSYARTSILHFAKQVLSSVTSPHSTSRAFQIPPIPPSMKMKIKQLWRKRRGSTEGEGRQENELNLNTNFRR